MAEEKKQDADKDASCCGASSCCAGSKKFIAGVLLGLILTAAAFGFYSAGACAAKGKICPLASQMQLQK